MEFWEKLKDCKKVVVTASVKPERCIRCKETVEVKSFRLMPGRYTAKGYVCESCCGKK